MGTPTRPAQSLAEAYAGLDADQKRRCEQYAAWCAAHVTVATGRYDAAGKPVMRAAQVTPIEAAVNSGLIADPNARTIHNTSMERLLELAAR